MADLKNSIPDAQTLLGLPIQDLASRVLSVLVENHGSLTKEHRGNFTMRQAQSFPQAGSGNDPRVGQRCAEAWDWLEVNGLISEHYESTNGWFVVTERGLPLGDPTQFQAFVAASALPEIYLHPQILVHARPLFLQGRYDTAVFEAFKALEIEVRAASGFGDELIGVKLVSRAFNPEDGPLTDMTAELGERVALMNLMSGAIGSYKNPSSHRRMAITANEAREMIILASHLLAVVDSRRR